MRSGREEGVRRIRVWARMYNHKLESGEEARESAREYLELGVD